MCRETARHLRLPFLGLCILGAAYGIYEEALVDRFWFDPEYWDEVGIESYSVVWHTNVLIATHLTAFHAAVSVVASVLVVERLFPAYRDRPWVGRRGLCAAGLALVALVPLLSAEFPWPPLPVVGAATVLLGSIVVLAISTRSWRRRAPTARRSRRRGVGAVAFVCTATHFFLTYAIPSSGLPWPVGVGVALAPVAAGVLFVRRSAIDDPYGPDGLRVVTGVLAFFIVLSVAVGLAGRYDLTIAALAVGYGLRRLRVTPASLNRGG